MKACLPLVGAALTLGATLRAQPRPAEDRIRAALGVFGGESRVRRLTSVIVRGSGSEYGTADQGRRPLDGSPVKPTAGNAHQEGTIIDLSGRRAANEYRTDRGDGSTRWRRFLYDSTGRLTLDFPSRRVYARQNGDVPEERRELARRIPPLLLLELLDHRDRVKAEADTVTGGRVRHVLAYAVPGRAATIRLFIDSATNRLERVAQDIDYPGLGDARLETIYDAYASHARLGAYPRGHRIQLQGVDYQRVAYSAVRVDDVAGVAATFSIDPTLARVTPSGAASAAVEEPTPHRIADGVFLVPVGNGDYGLVVEFADFVLAAEASARLPGLTGIPAEDRPGSAAMSDRFIERIHASFPGKPIRYVVATHHHGDHAGGVRAFLAEGATVVTTPGNRAFFDALARGKMTRTPDRFAAGHPPVRVETFSGRRSIVDSTQAVELISVGANPHTEEMLVVYLPRSGILFQGDLFYYDGDAGFPDPNRVPIMRAFARWLVSNDLSPAQIYGTHMPMPATMTHVRKLLDGMPAPRLR